MSQTVVESSKGPRLTIQLPVRAEWNEERTGKHIVAEGTTENVGPEGALVTLERLPSVGSRIRITVTVASGGPHLETVAEVVRLVRDLRQPQASLSVVKARKEWRGMVWEPVRTGITQSFGKAADASKGVASSKD